MFESCWQLNACKAYAVMEYIVTQIFQLRGHINTFQRRTAHESKITYIRNAVCHCYALDACAVIKSIIADTRHAIGDNYFLYIRPSDPGRGLAAGFHLAAAAYRKSTLSVQYPCDVVTDTAAVCDKLVCYNNVHNVLEQIKNEGGHIYLLSNAQRLFTQKELNDTNLTKYFDDIFISSDKGVKKPDSSFINELLEKHSLIKSETVMIGNEIKSDIGSAVAAGIDGIYLNTYSHTQQELDSELSAINFDKSNITLTIIDNGENCVDMLEI